MDSLKGEMCYVDVRLRRLCEEKIIILSILLRVWLILLGNKLGRMKEHILNT